MKKLLRIILSVVILFATCLTACNQSGDDSNEACVHNWEDVSELNSKVCSLCGAFDGIEVTKQKWDEVLKEEFLDNITLISTTVAEEAYQYNVETGVYDYIKMEDIIPYKSVYILKLTNDKYYLKNEIYDINGRVGALCQEQVGESVAMQKQIQHNFFAEIFNEYDNFIFDKEKDIYISSNEIIYEMYIDVSGNLMPARVILTDVKLKFDKDSKLAYLECYRTQEAYLNNIVYSVYTGRMVITCSDYGTTVIE